MCLVSIITPTYNSDGFIEETYRSIISQTYSSWKWFVTDDCSDDNTWEILRTISKADDRVFIQKTRINSGAAAARNCSLSVADGEFISFIDADDLWLPNKLQNQIDFMNNDINFSFTAYEIIDENGFPRNRYIDRNNQSSFNYDDMLKKKATLGCSTVMLRKNAFNDITMPNIRTGQDYALWLKLLQTGSLAYLLNESLTKYRIVSNSISRNKLKKALRQWEIYTKIEKLSYVKAIECFFWYAFRAISR
jgi:glycosyltransferase involved in cell wall biosynthesis